MATACDPQVSAPSLQSPAEPQQAATSESSYGQILKSSTLVGGAQVVNIAIGIGRTKVLALLLGPGGFGLAGLYNSITDLTQSIAGMGVNGSGVRQIAEAVHSDDAERIGVTVAVLRRTSVILGIIGALALMIFCHQVSMLTFGSDKYATGVAVVSVAAFCKLVSGGQGALIQGMRRITDLAKMNILGGLYGAVAAIALVYFFRENGIVPYIIAIAVMTVLMSWWYSRKITIQSPRVPVSQVMNEARALLKLGLAFMVSGMMTLGVGYSIRVIVLHRVGLAGTGLYQSAWNLGGMYVAFILQAMAADFYPRLTGHINDHATANRLVNEQARVGLLLAAPGVVATLTLAPVVIAVFYSAKFTGSVPILRWVCLGATLQVITWPMGFIIVAKGRQNLFIFCEVAWAVASLVLTWYCIGVFGLSGAGMAFFLSYIFHGFLVYPIARRLTGFRWSKENIQTSGIFLAAIAIVFYMFYVLPRYPAFALGMVATLITTVYSLRIFVKILPPDDVPTPIRRLLAMLGVGAFQSAGANGETH